MHFILVVIGLFLSCCSCANPVHEYRLDNGLKILVQEDHRAQVACFQIWYKIGGSYDPEGSTGISHMLEHMMFKSTKHLPNGAFARILAANGAQRNAATSHDYTYYYENIVANKLPLVFKLEADRMQNLSFKQAEFAKELQVVQEERRLRIDNQPPSILLERFRAISFLSSPYQHANVGWMSDLKNLTVDKARDWYQKWYVPNNATLVVVGDVVPQQIYQYAKQYFGPIPAKPIPKIRTHADLPVLGPREVIVNIPAKNAELLLGFNVPVAATAKQAWEAYALILLKQVLVGSRQAQLNKHLLYEQTIASNIDILYEPFQFRLDDIFTIMANPAPGVSLPQLKTAILAEIKQLQISLISAEELNRIKSSLIAKDIYTMDSLAQRAKQLGRYETIGLSWRQVADYEKNIQQITPEQIQWVAKRYLVSERTITGMLIPKIK